MNKLLLLVLSLGVVLRLGFLSTVPPSLNWDEVSIGYNSYSLLHTAKDEWGQLLPSLFRAYGDYKLPLYLYMTSLFQLILGPTVLATRLTSALSGSILIYLAFLIAGEISKHIFSKDRYIRLTQLFAALLVAIEPWTLFLSRIAVEANLSSCMIAAGVYFAIKKRYLPMVVSLGLSVWAYNSARVFVPLFLLVYFLMNRKDILKFLLTKKGIITATIFISLFLPMFFQLFSPAGRARYQWLSLLGPAGIHEINTRRGESKLPSSVAKLIYNKPLFLGETIFKNYISYFSPRFIFLKGGSHYQFNIPDQGLAYLLNFPFLLVGLIMLFRKKDLKLVIAWLLLSPIAGSLTKDSPHTLRFSPILPLPMILSGIGVVALVSTFRVTYQKICIAIYLLALTLSFTLFIKKYVYEYTPNYSWVWQYGNQEMVSAIRSNYDRYDQFIITKKYGEPHEFILFYWPWNPDAYLNDPNLVRFAQSDWYWVDRFDKFLFVNDWQVKDLVTESGIQIDPQIKSLLITSKGNFPDGWNKIGEINYLDGKTAYEIFEN
jgi:hypothetical protein